ncbi:MAG: class I SAM-dependent methyltransferase [Oscillospiraceae bacterium]|nr:class I SAM-dependent methyltransferase [Oscillospiraceae bacterium]
MNALTVAHEFIKQHTPVGGTVIDATAGRGGDTALLCSLVRECGKVIALDIQEDAVRQTRERIAAEGYENICTVCQDSHENLMSYAEENSVDGIVFNFGWLPGGDHDVHTKAETSIAAIAGGLRLLKKGGYMSLCVYYGRNNGYTERDAILEYVQQLDDRKYTVMLLTFPNRKNDPPFPIMIIRDI